MYELNLNLRKFLSLLSVEEKKRAFFLLIMIIAMTFIEMLGIASILPFITILTNPALLETNYILNYFFEFSKNIGIKTEFHFLFVLGTIVFIFLATSNAFKTYTTYIQVNFVQMLEFSIGKRMITGFLNKEYSWFLSRNSSDIGKTILSEVSQIIGYGIRPLMELVAKSMVALSIIILLIIVDPLLAFLTGLSLGIAYSVIFFLIRRLLRNAGEIRLKNNQIRFTTVNESFSASKELKIGRLENTYIERFSKAAKLYAQMETLSQVIAQIPRFVIEIIAFGGILLIILFIMAKTGSVTGSLPIVSLYAFAGYRLMPALQQIYSSITQLTYVGPSLNKICEDFNGLDDIQYEEDDDNQFPLNKNIVLKDIQYNYPNSSRIILNKVSIKIPAKSTIGIIGITGSGKSTIVDIILGLLEPFSGTIEVDGKQITKKNIRNFQRIIGYVPQNIYLFDDTIKSNIALGVKPGDINNDLVEKASKIANLHQFIMNELPEKYQTNIGERGIKLSGGQRQRVGIARAIYNNPKLLVLDEATSALDNQTEKSVMDAIDNLKNNITIILIAHRLNTIKNCDIIFYLDKGKIKDQGTYIEIITRNKNLINDNKKYKDENSKKFN